MSVKFDISAPYDVEETDVAFARPAGHRAVGARLSRQGPGHGPVAGRRRRARRRVDAARSDDRGDPWPRAGGLRGRGRRARLPHGTPITSTRRRARTWPRGCAGCAPTRAGSASIPIASGIAGSSSGGHLASLLAVTPKAAFHDGTPIIMPDGSPRRRATAIFAWPSRWWRTRSAIPSPGTATCSHARTSRRSPRASAPSGSSMPTMGSFETRRTWPR